MLFESFWAARERAGLLLEKSPWISALAKSTTFSTPVTRNQAFLIFHGLYLHYLNISKPLFGLHFWGGLWPRMRSRSQPTCTSRDDVGWPKGFWTSENCCTYTWCPLIVAGSAKISCLLATWVVGAYHRWHSISKRGLLGCLGHFDLRGLPGCNSWDDTFMCCSSEYKQPEAWL